MSTDQREKTEFERQGEQRRHGLLSEFWGFLKHNKKWWLLPILVMLFGVGILVILASTGAAPFIYTLF